jgi:hypothetical protein
VELSILLSRKLGSVRNRLSFVRTRAIQQLRHRGIPSIDTFLPSRNQSAASFEPIARRKLTNCQLDLGVPLGRGREGSRGIGGLPARPPSRAGQSLPQHRVALTDWREGDDGEHAVVGGDD